MIYFDCDYNEGAREKIMQRLLETNMEQTPGQGCDVYCERARELIKKMIKKSKSKVTKTIKMKAIIKLS